MEISTTFPFDKDISDTRETPAIRPFSTFNSGTERGRQVFAIVAAGSDSAIGKDGDMPWHISADLKRFKALTTGHPVIMGRATWESLPKKPLPGRRNIVLSRRDDFSPEGAERAGSIEEALAMIPANEIPFIMGGGKVYEAALPYCTRIYLTLVEADYPEADTRFPYLDPAHWKITEKESPLPAPDSPHFSFLTLARI